MYNPPEQAIHEQADRLRLRAKAIRERFGKVYTIIAPPRTASTPLALALTMQPSIRYYRHEPFEERYFDGKPVEHALQMIENPDDMHVHFASKRGQEGTSLLIKEMPYQVGLYINLLYDITTQPPIFLIRDPRLSIMSRMVKKKEAGQNPNFPLLETGWELLVQHMETCDARGMDYTIVEATDFRTRPQTVFQSLFEAYNLPFTPDMLQWEPVPHLQLDNLGGRHDHLYRRVKESRGIEPPTERIPELSEFPAETCMRRHVEEALEIYHSLLQSPRRIRG